MLPVLGRQYGDALEEGELSVAFDAGSLLLRDFDRLLPLDPKTPPMILGNNLDELRVSLADTAETFADTESILTALEHLPPRPRPRVRKSSSDSATSKSSSGGCASWRRVRPPSSSSSRRISPRLTACPTIRRKSIGSMRFTAQVYRLCHWKAAGDEVNYRRFFDINELAALCIEDPEAFYQTHRLVMRLLADDAAAGLRIDHIDGLYAPEQYLWRLQWGYLAELVIRARARAGRDAARRRAVDR